MGHHNVRFTSALANRPTYGGIYTSDIVYLSLGAFLVTRALEGVSLEILYGAILLVCIPLYLFLIVKNRWLSKGWFLFLMRSILRLNSKQVSPKYDLAKK